MKKVIAFLLSLTLILTLYLPTFAATNTDHTVATTSIEYLEDGSYIETVITKERSSLSIFATSTKTGSKKITHKNSDSETLWTATLKGTFTYTGSKATCTASSITYSIVNDNWKIMSATASKSGNKATGDITAKRYVLGIPTKTVEKTITLTCSASGVLS